MKTTLRHLLLLSATLCLSACFPEERIWWSPLGDRAVVSVSDALHLVSADGELGPLVVQGVSGEHASIKMVSWLGDGSGFVCHRERVIKTWDEMRKLIPEDEVATVEKMATAVLPLLDAGLLLAGEEDSLEAILSSLPVKDRKQFGMAVLMAFQKDPAGMEKHLLSLPKGGKILEVLKDEEAGFHVSELCLVRLGAAVEVIPIKSTRSLLRPSLLPKVSPKHNVVACLKLDQDGENAALEVLSLDGGNALIIARNVSGAFEWMPDGRSLAFMAPIGSDGEKLQSIHRVAVVQDSGAVMLPREEEREDGTRTLSKAPDHLSDPVVLATAIVLNRPTLQALPDGRLLFASQPATLPALGTGAELEPRLYVISTDGKAVSPIATAPGDLPTDLAWFVASPDGRHVAVVESETDAVAVVELDTGKTEIISPPHPRWQCETIPAWKSATELTFAALHGPAGQPKWMLWTKGAGVRCISEKWPASATAEWLEEKREDKPEAPASAK